MLQKGFVVFVENEIILFETEDRSITLPVQVSTDTVWLNRSQLAELFGRDVKTIGKHIGNALKEEFTERELDVLRELVTCATNEQIADKLGVSVNTVKTHIRHMLEKTGFTDRLELAVHASRRNIVVNDRDLHGGTAGQFP